MIQVGNTGLYFDGGNKGHFDIYFKRNKIFRNHHLSVSHLSGTDVDCTGEVFKAILKYADFKIDGQRFLKDNEYLIHSCIKEQFKGKKSICKCWNCGLDKNTFNNYEGDLCPPMGVTPDWEWDHNNSKLKQCDKSLNLKEYPIVSLKEFDLRSQYISRLLLNCKIKSIKNPEVDDGKYIQECTFGDDDTSKVIKGVLANNVADFDKWNPGDYVEAFGIYDFGTFHVFDLNLIKKDDSKPIPINRNDENPGYNDWRKSILNRDQKCVCCGHDQHLEAHHLFGYKETPSLAVNESNGVALCKFCHDKYHNIYGVKDINPVDFVNFIKRFGVR